MNQNQPLKSAANAAAQPLFIATDQALQEAAINWKAGAVLALDTEFIRERTYYARLGLVQVSDGVTVWLIDPLSIQNFEPLITMLKHPEILKLLHSPSEDLEVLQHTLGCMPEPMFDLQLAAAALGQPLQISYQKLLEWQLDVHIDKGESRSNWLQRPLTASQLHYAALDVSYLPLVYAQASSELKSRKRLKWVFEDSQLQLNKARETIDPASLYLKFRNAWRLQPLQQLVLQKLCLWREAEAEKRDLPRSFVLKDNEAMAISQALPRSFHDLQNASKMHPRALQRYAKNILALIESCDQQFQQASCSPKPAVAMPLNTTEKHCIQQARDEIAAIAKANDLEAGILGSKRDLEALIRLRPTEKLPAKYQGWRKSLLASILDQINLLPRTS